MSGNASHTLGIDWSAVDTVPQFTVGEIKQDRNGNHYQYVKAHVALTSGNLVIIPSTYIIGANGATTTLVDAVNPCSLGIVTHANFTVVDTYGWVFVGPGQASVLAFTACAADVPVYTHATDGQVDDTSTTLVVGLKLNSLVGGAPAITACTAVTKLYAA